MALSLVAEAAHDFSQRMHELGFHTRWLCDNEESRVAVGGQISGNPYFDMFEHRATVFFRSDGIEVMGDQDHDTIATARDAWHAHFDGQLAEAG